jgi:hypothetical protein
MTENLNSEQITGILEVGEDITHARLSMVRKDYSIIEEGKHGTERDCTRGTMGRSY